MFNFSRPTLDFRHTLPCFWLMSNRPDLADCCVVISLFSSWSWSVQQIAHQADDKALHSSCCCERSVRLTSHLQKVHDLHLHQYQQLSEDCQVSSFDWKNLFYNIPHHQYHWACQTCAQHKLEMPLEDQWMTTCCFYRHYCILSQDLVLHDRYMLVLVWEIFLPSQSFLLSAKCRLQQDSEMLEINVLRHNCFLFHLVHSWHPREKVDWKMMKATVAWNVLKVVLIGIYQH